MSDPRDLEASLAEMDRKLRELQRELALVSRPAEPAPAPQPAPPPPPPPVSPAGDILEQAAARVAELSRRIEELARLGDDLDEATRALQEEQRRATPPPAPAPEPAAPGLPAPGDVVVNVGPFADIATLGAFEHALRRVDGVEDALVRSFEGNRAIVDVRLSRAIDLPASLRGTVPFAFDVVAAGRGELTLTLRLPTG